MGGAGALVLIDDLANEAHVVLKYDGELDRAGQVLVAQRALFALSNYIRALQREG